MFDLIGLLAGIFMGWRTQSPPLTPVKTLAWEELTLFSLPYPPEPMIEETVTAYFDNLSRLGPDSRSQGLWLASPWWTFAEHRGTIPQSAASLTKLVTSLAALERYGQGFQFETLVKQRGTLSNGVLKGDLVIEGGGDPFFVWEEAIALANRLNELGIKTVQGNLIITGDFYLNYEHNPLTVAQLFTQALNSQVWSSKIQQQYEKLPPETPRPQVQILGRILFQTQAIAEAKTMIRHQSLPLRQILREMNVYSNNQMSELIARSLGGAKNMAEIAAQSAEVSLEEIQIINGSGLGLENRISPRAVTKVLQAMQEKLEENGGTLGDVLPVSGIAEGTIRDRAIPFGIPVKTGSLWKVSALAGAIPTEQHGYIYFTIINQDGNLETFRQLQDELLQNLDQTWDLNPLENPSPVKLGDPKRSQLTIDN